MSKGRKVFFLYTFIISILILVGFSLRYIYNERETYFIVVRIYNIFEYAILSWLFFLYIKNKTIKYILLFSSIPFIAYCTFDFLIAPRPTLPFIPLILEYLILLIFIIYFFFEVIQETVIEPIYTKAIFWISVAFIINFSGNFFLFLYSKNSFNNEEFQRQYTIIYSSVTILKNILLCISVTIKDKEANEIHSLHDSFIDSSLDSNLPFKTQK